MKRHIQFRVHDVNGNVLGFEMLDEQGWHHYLIADYKEGENIHPAQSGCIPYPGERVQYIGKTAKSLKADGRRVAVFEGDTVKNSSGFVGVVKWFEEDMSFGIESSDPMGHRIEDLEIIGSIAYEKR